MSFSVVFCAIFLNKFEFSTALFASMVMDRMTDDIREEAPWTMMFADDIVICSESKEHVEEKLESWRYALERRGMKVNRRKTVKWSEKWQMCVGRPCLPV